MGREYGKMRGGPGKRVGRKEILDGRMGRVLWGHDFPQETLSHLCSKLGNGGTGHECMES